MTQPLPFDRPSDPVYHTVPLSHVLELPVLGVTVRFESNSRAALDAVEDAFGIWRGLFASPELIDPVTVRVRLIVHEGEEGSDPHAPVAWRLPDPDRLLIHTPGSMAIVDTRRRDAVAYITPNLLADRAHSQYALIHTLVVPLVDTCHRYPVHAALIARGPTALLLAGPAGTGKSTLAYQAHLHGLRVLSDDVSHIQLKPIFRVWGELPGRVYLTPKATAHFPGLTGQTPTLLANGTEKLLVRFPYEWAGPRGYAPMALQAGVCLLERKGGRASVTTAAPAEIETFLHTGLGIARVMFGPGVDDALTQIADGGGWKLSLSDDPKEALPLVDAMLTAVEQRD